MYGFCLLAPVDVDIANYYGPVYGNRQSGFHLVRVVYGMPAIQRRIERYGKFVAGGCVSRGIFDPKWVIIWE